MKRTSRIFRILILTVFIFAIMINYKSIKAVDLKFNASREIEGGVIIRTFAKAYQKSIEFFDGTGEKRGEFIYYDEDNKYALDGYRYSSESSLIEDFKSYNYVGTSLNYSSAGIQFQKDGLMTSNYNSGGTTISYALQRKSFDVEEITTQTSINLNNYTYENNTKYDISVNKELTSDKTKRYKAYNNSGFRMLRWTITQDNISVSDWFIPDEYIEEIEKSEYIVDGKVRFSLYTSVLANCYKQYCDTGWYGDECKSESSLMHTITSAIEVAMNTLKKLYGEDIIDTNKKPSVTSCPCNYEYITPSENPNANIRKIAYSTKEAYDITVYGEGVSFNESESGLRGITNSNNSLANDYDNWLILDPVVENIKKNVYVRHVDKDTGDLLAISNDNEIVESNGVATLKSPTSKNVKLGKYTYQEAFTKLDVDDIVTTSRSTTLVKDGIQYKYEGVKIGKASDINSAEINMDKSKMSKVEQVSDDTNQYEFVVITYYYTKQSITTNPPTLIIGGGSSTSSGNDCKTVEVSTGAEVSPYIVTPKYTVKDLKYSLNYDNTTKKITYTLNNFVVRKLTNASIINSNGYNYNGKTVTGKIITSSNERDALFSGSSGSLSLGYNLASMNESINSDYDKIKSTQKLSSINVDNIKGSNTTSSDFNNNKFAVLKNAYNGLRFLQGSATYEDYNVLKNSSSNSSTENTSNRQFVNVHNDITVGINSVSSPNVVNHTNQTGYTIQKNAEFTVKLNSKNQNYLDKYFLIFDFDIEYNGKKYAKNTWIEIKANKSDYTEFKAIPTSGTSSGDVIGQIENNMIVVGMSDNVPNRYKEKIFEQFTQDTLNEIYTSSISSVTLEKIGKSSNKVIRDNICNESTKLNVNNDSSFTNNINLYEDNYYFAWTKTTFKTLSRVYDFKVTDCLDVNYKSVFRKSDNSTVNSLTGTQYFSGTKELKIYGSSYNVLETRKNTSTLIPLGPYKHTDETYIFAPKLGYRISFDLKTSGYYDYSGNEDSGRKILIKPTYYYISKDGKTFKDNINIYYKNSDGKYQSFSNSNYSIFFTPNDGYRYINNIATTANTNNMSKKLTELKISNKDGFYITSNMMATSDNNFIQSWYGEFKLPNSSIAVEGSNVNKPLTNGYIGVRFEIKCIDTQDGKEIITSYNESNKSASSTTNTTQWDYEGYLGFSNPGSEANGLIIQLEKGTWNIDDDMYQKIKGTVILYDTDSRASEDFD